MTNKLNNLYFFTDRFYTMPGDSYNYGIVAAKDTAEAKLMLGTELVNGLLLGTTNVSGQVLCADGFRDINPRTKPVDHTVEAEYYRLKEGVDISERVEQIRTQIGKMQGIDCSNLHIDFTRALLIPGSCTSTGNDLWQVTITHPDFPNSVQIMLSAQGDGSITTDDKTNFEPLGEKTTYTYTVNEDLPLTPEWLLLDLLEKAGLTEDSWAILADVARKAAYSDKEVEGWEEVNEVYGDGASAHVLRFWLNPDWQKLITDAVTAIVGDLKKDEPQAMNLAEELAGSESADKAAE